MTITRFTSALIGTACQLLVAAPMTNLNAMADSLHSRREEQRDTTPSYPGLMECSPGSSGRCRIANSDMLCFTDSHRRLNLHEKDNEMCFKDIIDAKADSNTKSYSNDVNSMLQTEKSKGKNGLHLKACSRKKYKGSKNQRRKQKKKRLRLVLKKMNIK